MKKEDKEKLAKKIFRFLFLILLMTFFTLYLSQATGYYEFTEHKKVVFTNEQIKKFEQDVAEGKNVQIEDYLENQNKNYDNKVSKFGLQLSTMIGKYVKQGLEGTFNAINKWMES